eukprot:gnl/TRDRNA2_/TRDRNA2_156127_c0_seq1.p1 gnl/TRDRNA2_/TRDRNA2_156127_c0~~gnl/TRDRNA2_/TRDRNA2_156127_c0_seq1.p1  ORF type:complete len:199 (-),score=35.53 gnl/TRDRNA2_/TRDRNA2_156127_c0_seq1:167-712(-)
MAYKGLASFNKKENVTTEPAPKAVKVDEKPVTAADGSNAVGFQKMGMAQYWNVTDMKWYGPGGIGFTVGLKEFEDFHQKPFLKGVPDRHGGHHFCRIAERNYIASGGWPSLFCTHLGEYLGVPATNNSLNMRDFSFWRREGDLLIENWVMLDLFEIYEAMGVDLWAAVAAGRPNRTPEEYS